ncbi:class I SAM-dependent methyltransferase [Rhodovulum sp. DZ06]|uniref:class I SAM-dependent methyltransferase n=1 Tax=Rhodovulum sp. DZ06 TaxID=3425126 RepID=UPI003D33970C
MPVSQADFWNRIARKYAARPIGDEAAYREKLRRTQALFTPGTRALEFGCGTGSTALEHAPHVAHYRAGDIAGEMIAIAREKAAAAGVENVEFAVETLEDRAGDGPAWDAVLGLNILQLVPDVPETCARAFALTKPGGVFVTSTVTLGDRLLWARPLIWALKLVGKAPPVNYVSEAQVKRAMTDAGFVIEDAWRPNKALGIFMIARKPG